MRQMRGEMAREDADEVCAALIFFHVEPQLLSGDVRAHRCGEERSRLIREDRRLYAKTVIARNMGTAYDDARAELRYQMEQSPGKVNIINLLGVLLAAQSARAK